MKTFHRLAIAFVFSLTISGLAQAVPMGYDLIFKIEQGSNVNPYSVWSTQGGLNGGVSGSLDVSGNTGVNYKSDLVDNWPSNINVVWVSLFNNGNEVAHISFDATGSTNESFFDPSRVLSSTWDLSDGVFNYFSVQGDSGVRSFFIERNYGGCTTDAGYLVAVYNTGCEWERAISEYPHFLYSKDSAYTNWTVGNVGAADTFTVWVSSVPTPSVLLLVCPGLLGLGWKQHVRRIKV